MATSRSSTQSPSAARTWRSRCSRLVCRKTLESIFTLKKQLIETRKIIAPSRDVLNVLLRHDQGLFDATYVPYFQDVYDHTVRVIDSLDTYRDLFSSAIDIYLSLVSNNVNQTVKTMTALTAIFMVQALIAGIYGMNFDNMPELHWQYGYAWALGLMATVAAGMWALFRRMGWLSYLIRRDGLRQSLQVGTARVQPELSGGLN